MASRTNAPLLGIAIDITGDEYEWTAVVTPEHDHAGNHLLHFSPQSGDGAVGIINWPDFQKLHALLAHQLGVEA
jgi:hypothetical protein